MKLVIYLLIGVVVIYFLADTGIINLDASEQATDGIIAWFNGAYISTKDFLKGLF